MRATALTTEYATDPLGVGTSRPRFGWRLAGRAGLQTAYRLALGTGAAETAWESDAIESGDCSAVRYAGPPLRSRQRYWWRVRVRDDRGRWSPWSPPATFETALLEDADWTARWIGPDAAATANPIFRREFELTAEAVSARLYLCGLGYAVTSVNGRPVGDAVLDTPVTAYDKRVIATTHDVTALLRPGANVIAVELGRGFFATRDPDRFGWQEAAWSGEPRLLAQLEIAHRDGTRTTLVSDDRWRVTDGPTTFDAPFAGESYDARRRPAGWTLPGFDASAWPAATPVPAPSGRLESVVLEPIRVTRELPPVAIVELGDGRRLIDFGEHIAGWVRLRARGPAGDTVRIAYGELLGDDAGRLKPRGGPEIGDHPPLGDRFQVDEYTFAGDGVEEWEPRFTYKGFRYVEVTGPAEPANHALVARVVHTDAAATSWFTSSEPVLTWVHDAFRTTLLNNLHGLPTDTPAYEKAGWLGDANVAAEAMLYSLDLARLDDKWLRDIADSQAPDGALPAIVPAPAGSGFGWWGPTPAWTGAYAAHVLRYWWVYGDHSVVSAHYPSVLRHVDHLLDASDDGISAECFGDWASPGHPGRPPEPAGLAGTAYLHRQLQDTIQLATSLARSADVARLTQAAEHVARRFNETFLDRDAGVYRAEPGGPYRQTSNVLPLAFGLVPADVQQRVAGHLVAHLHDLGDHLDTGVLGTSLVFDVLTDHGYADLAHAVAAQRTIPGFGHWMDTGSTTLWERWEGLRSRNHYFFGSVVGWLIRSVAGISPQAPGYRLIRIDPRARGPLTHASARLRTVRGDAACSWRRTGDDLELTAEIPAGAEADVHLGGAVERVGPGRHTFVLPAVQRA